MNVDLKDFFPTINFGRVRGMFMAKPYERPPKVATVLAQLCCHNNSLPQGAPSSPVVSNMVCARLDGELQGLAKAQHCTYTRYADDITFSTTVAAFPLALTPSFNSPGDPLLSSKLDEVIESNGFAMNPKKRRLQPTNRRQEVTGLVVNRFPNVKRRFVRGIRATLHVWEKYGLKDAQEASDRAIIHALGSKVPRPSVSAALRGKIEFVRMVKGENDPVYLGLISRLGKLTPIATAPTNLLTNLEKVASVAAFQLSSPWKPSGTLTFFFSDIEGSTALTELLGDQKWVEVLGEHNHIIRTIVKSYGGNEVKTIGDAFMVTFNSAINAAACARDIQRKLRDRNQTTDVQVKVRIGLHTGEALEVQDDFFGYHVNLASRIASKAQPNQIVVSNLTRQMIEPSGQFTIKKLGASGLKGFTGIHHRYSVDWEN